MPAIAARQNARYHRWSANLHQSTSICLLIKNLFHPAGGLIRQTASVFESPERGFGQSAPGFIAESMMKAQRGEAAGGGAGGMPSFDDSM